MSAQSIPWGPVRSTLTEKFTFGDIKQIVGYGAIAYMAVQIAPQALGVPIVQGGKSSHLALCIGLHQFLIRAGGGLHAGIMPPSALFAFCFLPSRRIGHIATRGRIRKRLRWQHCLPVRRDDAHGDQIVVAVVADGHDLLRAAASALKCSVCNGRALTLTMPCSQP